MMRFSPLILRTMAVCGLMAVALLFWLAVIQPAREWAGANTENFAQRHNEAIRLKSAIIRLERERSALATDAELSDIWSARQSGAATAQVQARLGEISRNEGVSLRSISPLPQPDIPFAQAVAFRVEAEATLDRLVLFLRALEFHSPVLIVERANLRRLARPGQGAQQPAIFIQLDIIAPVFLDDEKT